jgi:hypothetical protein
MNFPLLLTERYVQSRRDELQMTHRDSPTRSDRVAELEALEARLVSEKPWHALRAQLKALGWHHKPEQGDVWLKKLPSGWIKRDFAAVLRETGLAAPEAPHAP